MVVIGSGNVAWHLIRAFSSRGIEVLQLLGRNRDTTAAMSEYFGIPYIMNPKSLITDADIYLVTVQDDQIRAIAENLRLPGQLVVHTSGFTGLEAIREVSGKTGVIWPLQTLTRGKEVVFTSIPLFLEANSPESLETLRSFSALISDRVYVADSPTRQKIHLAAVIAGNLTNHLYTLSARILEQEQVPWDVLAPLIRETARKAAEGHPAESQTGPAVRQDIRVLEKHLDLLREEPEFREIYRLISENIIQKHHHGNEEL